VNRRGRALVGGDARPLPGRNLGEIVEVEGRPAEGLLDALDRDGGFSVEAALHSRERGSVPIELSGVVGPAGDAARWLGVARDLTDRKWVSAFIRDEHRFLKNLHETTKLIDSERGLREFLLRTLQSATTFLHAGGGAILSSPWEGGGETGRDLTLTLRGV